MDNQAVKDALHAANDALCNKIGVRPYMPLTLTLDGSFWYVHGYAGNTYERYISGKHCLTPGDALASIMQVIDELPSPEKVPAPLVTEETA